MEVNLPNATVPANSAVVLNAETNVVTAIKNMNHARGELAAAAINGKIYAAGRTGKTGYGQVRFLILKNMIRPPNIWTDKASMPVALAGMASAVYSGKLYLFGGMINSTTENNITYIYNPMTNSWTTGALMPTARYACKAALLSDGKIYVVGGASRNISQSKLEVYDPVANTWSTKQDMPATLYYMGAAGSDSLFVVGGLNNTDNFK